MRRYLYKDIVEDEMQEDPVACSYEPETKRDFSKQQLKEELNKIGAMIDVLREVNIMDIVTQNEKKMSSLVIRTSESL